MGTLKHFWDIKGADLRSKFLIFMGIPISHCYMVVKAVCWLNYKWNKLKVFHLRCMRRILKIKWSGVIDDKISNKKVTGKFYNMTYVACYI